MRLRTKYLACAIPFAIAAFVGCRPSDDDVESSETAEANVELSPTVVVADKPTSNATEVLPDSLRIPAGVAQRYANLAPGTIFVGDRAAGAEDPAPTTAPANDTKDGGKEDGGGAGTAKDGGAAEVGDGGAPEANTGSSKNPDGFLRRIEAIRTEDGVIVMTTTPAKLTDAVLNGAIRASTGGGVSIDGESHASAGKEFPINLDIGSSTLFENVDVVDVDGKKTSFDESIEIETGRLSVNPSLAIDLMIREGKVGRFTALVQGQFDTSIDARVEVKPTGPISRDTARLLRGLPHEVSKVVYTSNPIPLSTFNVGGIPVATSVEFTVTMRCTMKFSGPFLAYPGFGARSFLKLSAIQTTGEWQPPSTSDFEIIPYFDLKKSSEIEGHCALETMARLSAYGSPGIVMTVVPYVDFRVGSSPVLIDDGDKLRHGPPGSLATAGVKGWLKGSADVFGIGEPLDQQLADWHSSETLQGKVEIPQ